MDFGDPATDFGEPDLDRDFFDPPGLECRDPVADLADPDLAEWADPERDLDFREPEGDLEPECSECAEPENENKKCK